MITYNEKHQKIIESGIDEIRKTLFGNDDNLIRELLVCLDFYLDPYYKNQLSDEKEIYDLLQELAVTSNNEDIREPLIKCLSPSERTKSMTNIFTYLRFLTQIVLILAHFSLYSRPISLKRAHLSHHFHRAFFCFGIH